VRLGFLENPRLRPIEPELDSMSNHISKSVNWLPEIRSSATSTIVGVVISFPISRSTTSTAPTTATQSC